MIQNEYFLACFLQKMNAYIQVEDFFVPVRFDETLNFERHLVLLRMTYLCQALPGHERVSLGSGITKLNFLIIYPGDASVDLSVVFQLKGCLSIDS